MKYKKGDIVFVKENKETAIISNSLLVHNESLMINEKNSLFCY